MPGNKLYLIEYVSSVVKEDIPSLSNSVKMQIKKTIEDKLIRDPMRFGKPLRHSLKGHRSLRVGDYRVIYRIDSENYKVIIITIKHRKHVYEN